ncbi:DUF4192 domain-containing protein [Demequina aurantiaca]|uniref:DUF4192 domain-containing protein n=1 Tax=Demequina aurantiaca TaxID=676200 RepID=UPI003D335579
MTIPTLRGPGELLATLPVVLGFTPVESVVVVSIRDRGEVGAVMRVDRDDCLVSEVLAPMSRAIAAHLTRDDAIAAILVSYTCEPVRLCCEAADAIRESITAVVPRVDSWAVSDGRYFAPGCADVTCCPIDGTPVPVASSSLAASPGAAWRTSAAHATARRYWGTAPEIERRRCARAADRWTAKRADDERGWRRRSLGLWHEHLVQGLGEDAGMSDTDLGKLVSGLADVRVRDALIVSLVPGSESAVADVLAGDPTESVARVLDAILDPHRGVALDDWQAASLRLVLGECIARSRRRDAAPLITMLALVDWWLGEPSEALSLCDAASACAPGYRLAGLLRATILAGIVPGWRA